MEKLNSLSVFFPAYNEEENIERTVKSAVEILPKVASLWEVVVINDGSTDQTGKITARLAFEDSRIRVVTHPKNLGYGAALISGFYNSCNEWIVYTDSDGQFDFSQIDRFLKYADKSDLIIGYRIKRADNFYRRTLQKVLSFGNFLLFGIWVKDVDCGFKLIKKEVIEKISHLTSESAMVETELLVKAKRAGFKIVQVGVDHFPRKGGKSTGGTLFIIYRAILEGLKIWSLLLREKKR